MGAVYAAFLPHPSRVPLFPIEAHPWFSQASAPSTAGAGGGQLGVWGGADSGPACGQGDRGVFSPLEGLFRVWWYLGAPGQLEECTRSSGSLRVDTAVTFAEACWPPASGCVWVHAGDSEWAQHFYSREVSMTCAEPVMFVLFGCLCCDPCLGSPDAVAQWAWASRQYGKPGGTSKCLTILWLGHPLGCCNGRRVGAFARGVHHLAGYACGMRDSLDSFGVSSGDTDTRGGGSVSATPLKPDFQGIYLKIYSPKISDRSQN